MPFSVAFWNVENFHGKKARARRVEKHIRALTRKEAPPDIIGLCEVKDKTLMRTLLTRNFADHDFGLSDTALIPKEGSRRSQIELLAGWRRGVFDQVLYTQRIELTGGRMSIRPGVLLSVRVRQIWNSATVPSKSRERTISGFRNVHQVFLSFFL